jgi:hypothetical protein
VSWYIYFTVNTHLPMMVSTLTHTFLSCWCARSVALDAMPIMGSRKIRVHLSWSLTVFDREAAGAHRWVARICFDPIGGNAELTAEVLPSGCRPRLTGIGRYMWRSRCGAGLCGVRVEGISSRTQFPTPSLFRGIPSLRYPPY